MGKNLFIAEKPSVANEFAKALHEQHSKYNGYLEGPNSVVTWCVGHLVTMSYPDVYDPNLKRWREDTLPFLPKEFLYEIIPNVQIQFGIVKNLLNRADIDCIYVCTDSGREGEYIYRLVDMMANVPNEKQRRRVWIDSQTEEEILRGIKQAKPLSEYDSLSDSAYLRAKEDYLMGINFSRILTIKYGYMLKNHLKLDKNVVVSVGRVMTCVLGMVVKREREIRKFKKTSFYRIVGTFSIGDNAHLYGEWKAVEGSDFFDSPKLYKENGFKEKSDAENLIKSLQAATNEAVVETVDKKKEKKNPPLLFNLAELQNECSKLFKISPDQTLQIVQDLYEKKLVTYPRTDARVLSTAVCKEITKNLHGLATLPQYLDYCKDIKQYGLFEKIDKSRYCDDKQITDHYAIIPTGQGFSALSGFETNSIERKVYDRIVRRFLSIFYPPAEYRKMSIKLLVGKEAFFSNFKALEKLGYLKVMGVESKSQDDKKQNGEGEEEVSETNFDNVAKLKKGSKLPVEKYEIKDGETSPPKRYNSGSLILAMENAGQFIEDEELRALVKGRGIGTSATRAEILSKLIKIEYLNLNKKTQIITPARLGELIYEIVKASIKPLLNPELTASWEKGLNMVAEGSIKQDEYLIKLEDFVSKLTNGCKQLGNYAPLSRIFSLVDVCYN